MPYNRYHWLFGAQTLGSGMFMEMPAELICVSEQGLDRINEPQRRSSTVMIDRTDRPHERSPDWTTITRGLLFSG